MPDHKLTYQSQADQYEALVNREDFQGNLLTTIQSIFPLSGLTIVESGTGSGRFAKLFAPFAKTIFAFDLSPAMIHTAKAGLDKMAVTNTFFGNADHRLIPLPDHTADLVISGWSVCYLKTWGDAYWKEEVNKALEEFQRLLKPTGKIMIVESLGTGETTPNPPEKLIPYLNYLEELGLQRFWIRTDYQFTTPEELKTLIGFFFGEEMVHAALKDNLCIMPECTGIWVKD